MAVRDNVNSNKKKQKQREDTKRKKAVERGVSLDELGSNEKIHFERLHMWVHYILSSLQKDRGKIPNNIGNRMMITNNVYVTRYYLTSIIQVQNMGLQTPIAFQGELAQHLRKEKCSAVLDFTMKQQPYDPKLDDVGLQQRVDLWAKTAEEEDASEKEKERCARCLYTYDIAKSGVPLYKTRFYIQLRAKTGSELTRAEKVVMTYLQSHDMEYELVTGDISDTLNYISPISDYHTSDLKNVKALITSEQTLAQMLPNSGSLNSIKGLFMGVDVKNGTPYKFDFKSITGARTIYVVAESGHGKTVTALNMCCSAVEEGYAVCVQDIKGNEFTNFIKSTGGYIVSLRENSSGFINSWRMHKEDVDEANADSYFRQRVAFSKEQLLILSGLQDYEARNDLEELLDSFHDSLYTSLGVISTNRNTWVNTDVLDPFVVYDKLMDYMTPSVIARYPGVSKKVLNSLRMYMSRDGSKSYIFKGEFDYASILRAGTLMFDFGLLEGSTELKDPVIFKLKFAYMKKLNAEYVAYKYSKGIKVLKVLEESQVAVNDPDVIKGYVDEVTLRRAQGQTTLILGNSVSALLDSPLGKPIIENITGLLVGNLESGAMKTVIDRFGLQEYSDILEELNIDEKYENAFLFINRMEKRAATPVLKVIWNKEHDYKLYTPTAQSNSGIL